MKKSSLRLLLTVCAIVLLAAVGFGIWRFTAGRVGAPGNEAVSAVEPRLDLLNARQATFGPEGGAMQVTDRTGIAMTLEVPPDAFAKPTLVKLIPFVPKKDAPYPTMGALVSPGDLVFEKPATLTFALAGGMRTEDAPAFAGTGGLRATGSAQVLRIVGTAYEPVLVIRPMETSAFLPASVTRGGAYVFDIKGKGQYAYAHRLLAEKRPPVLPALEAASALIGHNQTLSRSERARARAVAQAVLNAQSPRAVDLFAATVIDKALTAKTSFIPSAQARGLFDGYLETRCKDRSLSLQEYLAAAQTAELMGFEAIGEGCMDAARNIVAEEARRVLADPDASARDALIALQRVQIMGIDAESDLDERLYTKAQNIVAKEAEEVLRDSAADQTDVAVALQKVQSLGAGDESLQEDLQDKLRTALPPDPNKPPPAPLPGNEPQEDLIPGLDPAVIGVALLQFVGLESFDEAGIQEFVNGWYEKKDDFIELSEGLCAAIVEMGGTPPPECTGVALRMGSLFEQLKQEGNRAAGEVGDIQSLDYIVPDYGEGEPERDEDDGIDNEPPLEDLNPDIENEPPLEDLE